MVRVHLKRTRTEFLKMLFDSYVPKGPGETGAGARGNTGWDQLVEKKERAPWCCRNEGSERLGSPGPLPLNPTAMWSRPKG